MTGRGVCVTANRFYIHLNISHRLRAINDRQYLSTPGQCDYLANRHSQARRRDHVADTDHFGLLRYRAVESLEDGFEVMILRRYHDAVYTNASSLLKMFPNGAASLVFDIRR
jgi:hypothetical protein